MGCKPVCTTWEFVATPSVGDEYRPGGTEEGSPIGGPKGLGGVFSSKVGCFAPCYWEVRADPENEVCEIVYTPTDRLICQKAT